MIRAGLDLHTAISLLRSYAGPASQYTLRSCQVSTEAVVAYDRALAAIWSELLGRDISADDPWLWLPLRMSGCGASSARARQNTAPWAAWCAVADELVQHMRCRDVEHLFETVPPLAARISTLHSRLLSQGTMSSISFASAQRALTFDTKQKDLISHIHKQTLRTLRAAMDDNEIAFLRSASGQAAGAFL